MSQPLADIVLKQDKIGNSVVRKNITPAEAMFLIALHFKNAGDNPIIKLVEHAEDREEKQIAPLQKELDKWQAKLETDTDDLTITEEIRERRQASAQRKIDRLNSSIQDLRQIQSIRGLDASQEKIRLGFRYNQIVLNKFYPGDMPQMPTTFDQAMKFGIGKNIGAGSYDGYMVGANQLQGMAGQF